MEEIVPIEVVVVAVSSLTAIAVAFFTTRSNKDRRSQLLSDLEILEKLDSKSEAHVVLRTAVERRVIAMSDTGTKTRSWFGLNLGLIFLVLGFTLLSFINSLGGWWLVLHLLTGFFLLFGLVGVLTSWKKVSRDEKGNAIKQPKAKKESPVV